MIELLDFNIEKILMLFSISPGSRWNRKTIKEKTGIPNVVLDKYIFKLLNLGFLVSEKNLFMLNFKNMEIKKVIEKLSENYSKFKQLPLKDYFIIRSIAQKLSEIKDVGDVYLFGSYAKLIFKESSDIDIAIVSDNVSKKKVTESIRKLEKRYKKKIEHHFFTKNFYSNKRDPLVREILQHGVKLI